MEQPARFTKPRPGRKDRRGLSMPIIIKGNKMWRSVVKCLRWAFKQVTWRARFEAKMDDVFRRVLRLELDAAMRRRDTRTVYELGDMYRSLGYNSYMSEMINAYKKKHPITQRGAK